MLLFYTTSFNLVWIHSIITIIFYFENVAFFHAKLGSEVCPRVDNQTSGDTLQDLTRQLVEKSPSASYKQNKFKNKSQIYQIIIITIYFENVTFFHAKLKLGGNACPRVDNNLQCHFTENN